MVDCNGQHTAQFGIINQTGDVTIVVGWIQGICRSETIPQLPADYIRDTGVLQLPTSNQPGQSAYWQDLCRDKGLKIAVTDGSIAVKVRFRDGTEKDYRQNLDPSPTGQFKPNYLFVLNRTAGVDLLGNHTDQYELKSADQTPFIEA